MTGAEERGIVQRLVAAADAVLGGAHEALALIGAFPETEAALAALDPVQRTAARAMLKAVEQTQDVEARLFRAYLLAEAIDVTSLTARDIGNLMVKLGALESAEAWSDLARLRNRLAYEYPVAVAAQLERITAAAKAVPILHDILTRMNAFLADKGYLP